MTYTEQLERDAERTRSHLSASLDELRYRLSPGQVVDQLVDYVQDGSGGQFFHNLKRQVTTNPLPVTLIGAGVALLMFANGHASPNGGGDGRRSGMRDRRAIGRTADTLSETGAAMSARAHAAVSYTHLTLPTKA